MWQIGYYDHTTGREGRMPAIYNRKCDCEADLNRHLLAGHDVWIVEIES